MLYCLRLAGKCVPSVSACEFPSQGQAGVHFRGHVFISAQCAEITIAAAAAAALLFTVSAWQQSVLLSFVRPHRRVPTCVCGCVRVCVCVYTCNIVPCSELVGTDRKAHL